ncbi:MAG: Gfo/Idh/MocA family protein [Phycisphaerae bacterium]
MKHQRPRDKVRFGIVGLGFMGRGHAKAIVDDRSADFCLGAVADNFEAPAKSAGEEFGVPWFTSADAMFRSGLIDAALIVTPHYWHPVQTIQAARAGLAVLCEKPIAVTVGPARAMIAECRKHKAPLGVMFQSRTRGVMMKARQMVVSGELGEVFRVSMTATNWYRSQAYYDSGAWRGTWDGEGGGILLNQAPHHIDLFGWIAGMPKSITAFLDTRLHKIEVENTAHVICRYDGPKTGLIYASTAEWPGTFLVEIVGDKGTLLIDNNKLNFGRLARPLSADIAANKESRADFIVPPECKWEAVQIENDPGGDRINVIRAFAAHVLRGEEMVATGEDGLRQLEMTNAMYLSGFTGRSVDLPVDAAKMERLLARLERERSTGRGQGQRKAALSALRKLAR